MLLKAFLCAKSRFHLRFNPITFAYLIVITLNLYLRSLVPLNAALLTPHDDQLGIELSSSILSSGWLGEWNNRTLAKPPGYSLYLAFTHYIPIPFAILNQLFFIFVVMLLIIKLKKIGPSDFRFKELFFLICFTFLIFQPILFASGANRIYRSSITIGILTLLYSVILMGVFNKILISKNDSFFGLNNRFSIYLDFMCLSLIYAALRLFRYESFWILLCSVPLLLVAIALRRRMLNVDEGERRRFLKLLLPVPLILIIFYSGPILTVQELNRSAYGVNLTENYYQGSFPEAINLWASVEVGRDPRPYVLVSAQQRAAVYGVSKNASLMKPFLESPTNGWNVMVCNTLRMCDNSGAWFTWQVRDAAVATGLVYSERGFQSFFKEITIDIQNACDSSRFSCASKSNLVGTKPLLEIPVERLIDYTISNFNVLLPINSTSPIILNKPDSSGAPDEVVSMYHDVVRYSPTSNFDDKQLERTSKILNGISTLYLPLNLIVCLLGLIGLLIALIRRINLQIVLISIFLMGGMLSQLVGASLAQISFGTRPGTVIYLLSAFPMLHMFGVLGLLTLISHFPKKSLTKVPVPSKQDNNEV